MEQPQRDMQSDANVVPRSSSFGKIRRRLSRHLNLKDKITSNQDNLLQVPVATGTYVHTGFT